MSDEHELGSQEQGVRNELDRMPPELATGALAALAIGYAQQMDTGELPPREWIGAGAQLRQCMVQLREWAPGSDTGDSTDVKRERREQRMLKVVPE
jgi:hypothetical protein